MIYDFFMAALPWVLIAFVTAFACANMDRIIKWSNERNNNKDD